MISPNQINTQSEKIMLARKGKQKSNRYIGYAVQEKIQNHRDIVAGKNMSMKKQQRTGQDYA